MSLEQINDMVHKLALEDKIVLPSDHNDISIEESQESDKERALMKRRYILQELIETEKDYVNNLGNIVEGYINLLRNDTADIQVPEDLKNGKEKIIFGNIEAIYDLHKEFVIGHRCFIYFFNRFCLCF